MSVVKFEDELNNFFAKEVARKVCSPYKMNAVIMCNGAMGSGKSWTMMQLAIQISKEIAKRLGGKPEDYFNLENHVGIMLWDNLQKMYEHMDLHHHCVYICDDIGTVLNARKFTSTENISQNDRLQTCRPNSNVIIYTTPDKSLVDRVARILSGYQIQMLKPIRQSGLNVCEIKSIEVNSMGNLYYPFLQTHKGEKIVQHFFRAPPKEMTDKYDQMRQEASDELNRRSLAKIKEANETKAPATSKKDIITNLYTMWNLTDKSKTWKEICKENDLNYAYANKVVSENKE